MNVLPGPAERVKFANSLLLSVLVLRTALRGPTMISHCKRSPGQAAVRLAGRGAEPVLSLGWPSPPPGFPSIGNVRQKTLREGPAVTHQDRGLGSGVPHPPRPRTGNAPHSRRAGRAGEASSAFAAAQRWHRCLCLASGHQALESHGSTSSCCREGWGPLLSSHRQPCGTSHWATGPQPPPLTPLSTIHDRRRRPCDVTNEPMWEGRAHLHPLPPGPAAPTTPAPGATPNGRGFS